MAQTGRNCSLTKWLVVLALIITGNYAEEAITCSRGGGVCVSDYLCTGSGTINTSGDGLIDTRKTGGDEECPDGMVCCREDGNEICSGTCVSKGGCEESGLVDLRFGSGGCSGGEVCCEKSVVRCDGTCAAVDQCADVGKVDLRISDQLCPGTQVCCKKPKSTAVCIGKCVSADKCPKISNSVDLRVQTNEGCPADQVCCENVNTCDGQCVQRDQCGDNGIDLRVGDQNCSTNSVCCKNLKRTCTCVEPTQCAQMVNLRFSNECPFHQVCCDSTPEVNCNGLCTTSDQCEVSSNGTCAGGQMCCGKIKSPCDGKCVPQQQCADSSSGFDLRLSGGSCPGNAICCKNLKKSPNLCQGSCVPAQQCSPNNVDLRFSDGLCPLNLVCCSATKSSCSGTCVAGNQCLDNSLSINLRSGTESCLAGLICCHNVQSGSTCDGQCTARDRCLDSALGINLRIGDRSCPNDRICCNNLQESTCNCIPFEQCPELKSATTLINLRLEKGNCPTGKVCCPRPDIECTCVAQEQCNQTQFVDLRFGSRKCPANQICCTKLNILEKCDGSCVPRQDCSGFANSSSIDLRLSRSGCPANQVCCKSRCNGVCTPSEQCSDVSLGINLRNDDQECPRNLHCCKNPKVSKSSCGGKCVARDQCPFINLIDLRVSEDACPFPQVCCNLQQDPFSTPPLEGPKQWKTPDREINSSCDLKIDRASSTLSKADVPWLVTVWSRQVLFGVQRNQYECSGTLLSSDLILTSADCVSGMNAEKTFVRVGDFNLKPIETLSKRRERQVTMIETHPDYDGKSGYANVATLRLGKNSTTNANICLTQSSDVDSRCFLIGWNKQDISDSSIPNAIPAKNQLQSTDEGCPQGLICASGSITGDQCDNFQGSPLICYSTEDQLWKQAGIASKARCGGNEVPNSYTALSPHWMWIQEQISPSFVQMVKPVEPSRVYLPAKV